MSSARRILLALVALLVLEVVAAVLFHRDTAELERAAREGTARERALALHVLANRDTPVIFDAEDVRALLAEDEPLLRELAMTYDFARSDGAAAQQDWIDAHGEDVRARFFLVHQRLPMRRKHVAGWFATARD